MSRGASKLDKLEAEVHNLATATAMIEAEDLLEMSPAKLEALQKVAAEGVDTYSSTAVQLYHERMSALGSMEAPMLPPGCTGAWGWREDRQAALAEYDRAKSLETQLDAIPVAWVHSQIEAAVNGGPIDGSINQKQADQGRSWLWMMDVYAEPLLQMVSATADLHVEFNLARGLQAGLFELQDLIEQSADGVQDRSSVEYSFNQLQEAPIAMVEASGDTRLLAEVEQRATRIQVAMFELDSMETASELRAQMTEELQSRNSGTSQLSLTSSG